MTNLKKKISKGLGWIFLAAVGFLVGLTFVVMYRALTAWTVIGSNTVIAYTVISQSDSLKPLKQVVDAIAKRQKMRPYDKNDEIGRTSFRWENVTSISGNQKYELHISLQPTGPLKEADARKQTFYLSVVTNDSGKSDEWQKVAKDIESVITQVANVASVSIGLDVAVYGFCTSKERPERADTGCRFEVPFPVDFKTFNENILEPRAREQKKNPKSAPNF